MNMEQNINGLFRRDHVILRPLSELNGAVECLFYDAAELRWPVAVEDVPLADVLKLERV